MNMDVKDLLQYVRGEQASRIAAIVALVLALGFAGYSGWRLMGSLQDRSNLQDRYAMSAESLERAKQAQELTREDLQIELAALVEELEEARAKFPLEQEVSNEISSYYAYAAELETHLLRVEPMVSPLEEVGGYGASQFLIEAEGAVPNLLRLLERLSSGPFQTVAMDNVEIQPGDPATGSWRLTSRYIIEAETHNPGQNAQGDDQPVDAGTSDADGQ